MLTQDPSNRFHLLWWCGCDGANICGDAGEGRPAGAAGGEWATNAGRRDKLAAHGQPPGCGLALAAPHGYLTQKGGGGQSSKLACYNDEANGQHEGEGRMTDPAPTPLLQLILLLHC